MNKKSIEILRVCDQNYASNISFQIKCTYSHVVKVLNELEKMHLVFREQKGRKVLISLSKKGKELAEIYQKAYDFEKTL